jgi:hypothetical protein
MYIGCQYFENILRIYLEYAKNMSLFHNKLISFCFKCFLKYAKNNLPKILVLVVINKGFMQFPLEVFEIYEVGVLELSCKVPLGVWKVFHAGRRFLHFAFMSMFAPHGVGLPSNIMIYIIIYPGCC